MTKFSAGTFLEHVEYMPVLKDIYKSPNLAARFTLGFRILPQEIHAYVDLIDMREQLLQMPSMGGSGLYQSPHCAPTRTSREKPPRGGSYLNW